jgi:hypothetical protein
VQLRSCLMLSLNALMTSIVINIHMVSFLGNYVTPLHESDKTILQNVVFCKFCKTSYFASFAKTLYFAKSFTAYITMMYEYFNVISIDEPLPSVCSTSMLMVHLHICYYIMMQIVHTINWWYMLHM